MRLRFSGLIVGGVALLALPATAMANTIDVFPGHSIQKAVNKAHRGDTIKVHPGVYHQSVQIKKEGLTLKGAGADLKTGTVIKPGTSKRCGGGSAGICVLPHRAGHRQVRTNNTTVKGFVIRGFKAFGFIAEGGRRTTVTRNRFANDGEYGGAAFSSIRTRFAHNLATGNGEAGLYIGDSRHAKAVLRHNKARGNGSFGIFLRDSAHGRALNNTVVHNCLGIGVLNTGAPGNAKRWLIKGNDAERNNKFCKGEEGGPAISGTGIGLIGARRTVVRRNSVRQNKASRAGAPFAGGIIAISSKPFGGTDPANDTIARNFAFGNQPADLRWDGSGYHIRFKNNRCNTSQPPGFCS
jgi:parallel beta-helix repeat protein